MKQIQNFGLLFVLLASGLVAFLAASDDSLWIDEGRWAYAAIGKEGDVVALDATFSEWNSPKNWVRFSDPAKPFFGVQLWAWEKVFGHGERSLRLANLPWFLLAQLALWVGLKNTKTLRLVVALGVCLSPLLWFYLNETSHYVMLFAGACIVVGVMARLATTEAAQEPLGAGWFWSFGAGCLLLCGSNAIGIPWAGAAFLAALCLVAGRFKVRWGLGTFLPMVLTVASLLLLAAHYRYWNPTRSGMITGFGPANLAFAAYELLGFAGLGPGRLALRAGGIGALIHFGPLLAVLGACSLLLWVVAFREVRRRFDRRVWMAAAVYVLLPLLFIVGMAVKTHFKLLGRHLMPLEPVVILGVAIGLTALLKNGRMCGRLLAAGFCVLWLASSLSLRFASRHARDDYRSAAAVAATALQKGASVWWAADGATGEYYGVPLADSTGVKGKAFLSINLPSQALSRHPLPAMVVLSKVDVYDTGGALGKMLRENPYRQTHAFPAFTVWER
jgi:hypothetical protein